MSTPPKEPVPDPIVVPALTEPPKEPTPDATALPAPAAPPKEPPGGVPDAPPVPSPAASTLVAFQAPQAPNGRLLRTEVSPTGATVFALDVGLPFDAPQAPGPAISLDTP